MIDFGTVRPGKTLYIPFATYDSNDPSASVTMTGLATSDIEIYKNGSATQRSSDAGYALLDTDGIDFDSTTGIHGFSIDLADNTDSGFYVAGAQYWVVVSSVTVDAATINFIAATFRIGYPDALYDTTIATLASQTSFTLTAGPAEDNALNGCVVAIHDVASAVQMGFAVVSAYTGSSKTVTLTAGTTFTAAAGDNISVFPPSAMSWVVATAATNLATACANYSATRGFSGTALPAAAAESAGGLYTRGTGAGQVNQTGNGLLSVDVIQISSDATAADNAELMFDGTGYAGGTTKLKVDVDTIKTQAVTCAAGVTVGAWVGQTGAVLDGTGGKVLLQATQAGVTIPTVTTTTNVTNPVTLANGAHGGASATITLQTPIVANATQIEGGDATDALAAGAAAALAAVNLDHLVGTATGIPALPAGTFLDQVLADTSFGTSVLTNKRGLRKTGSVWQLYVRNATDDADILLKDLKDKDGNNISDVTAGVLAAELASSV